MNYEDDPQSHHPRSDTHTPQISKREVAIRYLTDYFGKWLYLRGMPMQDAEKMAIDTYKIVKRAEGFEV